MQYTINLNKEDIINIIAERFDVKSEQISFDNDNIEVKYEKSVNEPKKEIGFVQK